MTFRLWCICVAALLLLVVLPLHAGRLIPPSTAALVLEGDWEPYKEAQDLLGPVPFLVSRVPTPSFRKDPRAAARFPQSVHDFFKENHQERYLVGWMKERDKKNTEWPFILSALDGNITLFWMQQTDRRDEPAVRKYFVNVARGATPEHDLLFLSETSHDNCWVFRRVKKAP